jgi:hypothetical protein
MAAELYIKEVDESPENAVEAETVLDEGDLVTTRVGGGLDAPDVTAGDEVVGIIPHRMRGPQLRENDEVYEPVQYEVGEGPVPFYGLHDGMKLTRQALTAAEKVEVYDDVALDANLDVVPASSSNAATEVLGKALHYAAAGEGVPVRVGL